jgi:hypothetical protein
MSYENDINWYFYVLTSVLVSLGLPKRREKMRERKERIV